jgi:poly(hydroxyalkanoate) granule-associated protein
VIESAQGSMQTRLGSARDQATETWDNLEALFQSRVQKALQQIGVPNASEIRLLTKRVAELNDNVKALSARSSRPRRARAKAKRKA